MIEKDHQQRDKELVRNHQAIITEINSCLSKWGGNRYNLRRMIKSKGSIVPRCTDIASQKVYLGEQSPYGNCLLPSVRGSEGHWMDKGQGQRQKFLCLWSGVPKPLSFKDKGEGRDQDRQALGLQCCKFTDDLRFKNAYHGGTLCFPLWGGRVHGTACWGATEPSISWCQDRWPHTFLSPGSRLCSEGRCGSCVPACTYLCTHTEVSSWQNVEGVELPTLSRFSEPSPDFLCGKLTD